MRLLIMLGFLATPVFALAVDDKPPKLDPVPEMEQVTEVPEPPLPVESGESLQPDITIIRKGENLIQEYRRGGKLYMIKVIPDVGPPYYFIDTNGDGNLDVRGSDLDRGSKINMWKILEWN